MKRLWLWIVMGVWASFMAARCLPFKLISPIQIPPNTRITKRYSSAQCQKAESPSSQYSRKGMPRKTTLKLSAAVSSSLPLRGMVQA